MGDPFVDRSVRPHSSRWLPALSQLLRPFSACSTVSVSERERAPWPRPHLGFQHSLVFSFLSASDVTVARAFQKPCCIVNFDPIFSISSLHQLSGLSYRPIHCFFFCFFVQFGQVVVNSDKQFLQSWSWVSLVPNTVSLDLGLALVLAVSWLRQSWPHQY